MNLSGRSLCGNPQQGLAKEQRREEPRKKLRGERSGVFRAKGCRHVNGQSVVFKRSTGGLPRRPCQDERARCPLWADFSALRDTRGFDFCVRSA